jgi:hypothetical protein
MDSSTRFSLTLRTLLVSWHLPTTDNTQNLSRNCEYPPSSESCKAELILGRTFPMTVQTRILVRRFNRMTADVPHTSYLAVLSVPLQIVATSEYKFMCSAYGKGWQYCTIHVPTVRKPWKLQPPPPPHLGLYRDSSTLAIWLHVQIKTWHAKTRSAVLACCQSVNLQVSLQRSPLTATEP